MANAGLKYKIFDWLDISGRVRIDNAITRHTKNCMLAQMLNWLKAKDIMEIIQILTNRLMQMYW